MDRELLRCIKQIEAAKRNVEAARQEAELHHPRIAARLRIITEELLLIGVVAEHDGGMLGNPDYIPESEDTKITNIPPSSGVDKLK